ncbi:MAG: hypothetical protein C5B52_10280 [Bacteroidetes bacterium]|nr:MAG: hypothetical protein C5B52_10280 [Bacteroidota bacterium]
MTASKFSAGTIFLALVFCFSCSKLPSSSSYWESNAKDDQSLHVSGYDETSGIRYVISNDKTNLYFTFTTMNPGVEKSILENGVMLYLSKGKKEDKSTYLKFPLPSGFDQATGKNKWQAKSGTNHPNADTRMYTEAMWVKNDVVRFVKTNNANGFSGHFEVDSTGNCNYRVSVPLTEIDPSGIKNINNLAVGMEIENFATNNAYHKNPNAYPGGHSGSRGGYGGRSRMSGGSSMSNGAAEYYHPQSVKIWFTTKPAQS